MDLEEFKSIRIIHDITSRVEFIFLAEFFRLCGIYVGEYIYYSENGNEELNIENMNSDDEFDADVYVGSGELPKKFQKEDSIFLKELLWEENEKQKPQNIIVLPCENKKQVLYKINEKIKSILDKKSKNIDVKSFNLIADVYVEKNLMLYCANIQYYRMKYEKQKEVVKTFSESYEMFREIMNNNNERHIFYAKLYCASKANSACFYGRYAFEYEIEQLIEEARQLINQASDFSNAKVLLGLIYEHFPEYAREAVQAFKDALVFEKDYSYSSHIYYWIAKRYEVYEDGKERAKDYYKKAYNKKKRFRNIYKLAMIDRSNGEYDSALEYFDIILRHLEIKSKRKCLDPLEIEYYYKVNSAASHICCMCTKKYDEAIKYGERAIEIYEKLNEEKFFCIFYGNEQEEYRKLSKDRMNLNRIYQYLAISYRETSKPILADENWDRVIIG